MNSWFIDFLLSINEMLYDVHFIYTKVLENEYIFKFFKGSQP